MKCGTCNKEVYKSGEYVPIEEDRCTCAADGAGAKFDGDKPRWDLLPYAEVEEIVEILTLGSKKYADNNWKKVPNGKSRYIAALMRHLVAWIISFGRAKDPDTGKSHLAHAGCCLLFLMWFDKHVTEGKVDA